MKMRFLQVQQSVMCPLQRAFKAAQVRKRTLLKDQDSGRPKQHMAQNRRIQHAAR